MGDDRAEHAPSAVVGPGPAELRSALVEAERVARYWFAARLTKGGRVLDVGCGVGDGSAILAGEASEVVGVDAPTAVVEVAQSNEQRNLRFERCDLGHLDFPDDSFDVVVCFDVIGRVDDGEALLPEVDRVLAPDGVLVISWSLQRNLQADLEQRWPHVRLLGQESWFGVAVLDAAEPASEGHAPLDGLQVHRANAQRPPTTTGTIALASTGELPIPTPVASVAGAADVQGWLRGGDERQREVDDLHRRIAELSTMRRERDELRARLIEAEGRTERLLQLEADLEQAEWRRGELQGRLAHLEGEVPGLQSQLEAVSQILDDVVGSPSWRLTRPLRAVKQWLRGD